MKWKDIRCLEEKDREDVRNTREHEFPGGDKLGGLQMVGKPMKKPYRGELLIKSHSVTNVTSDCSLFH